MPTSAWSHGRSLSTPPEEKHVMTDLIGRTSHRLSLQLPGRVSVPGQDRYAAAAEIWQSPTVPRARWFAVGRQAAIRAARSCDLPFSVRGGGLAVRCATG